MTESDERAPLDDTADPTADADANDPDEAAEPKPMGGDDDLLSGQYGPTADDGVG